MNARRREALELLMSHPDTVVAEMLGVKLATLREWMRQDDFAEALRRRDMEQRASLSRVARQAALNAATSLCQVASEPAQSDAKVLLELLKLSGAFEENACDPGEALAEIIRQAAKAEEVEVGD